MTNHSIHCRCFMCRPRSRVFSMPHPDTAEAEDERIEKMREHFRQRGSEIVRRRERAMATALAWPILEGK